MTRDFFPEQLQVDEVDKFRVRLSWEDQSGSQQAQVLERSQLPSVVRLLQKEITQGSGAPINLESLRPAQPFAVRALQFGSQADQLVLTASVYLPGQDRTVTIPLRLTKDEALSCISEMTRWLAGKF